MRKNGIGLLVGVLGALGYAATAEAQSPGIQPIGPLSIVAGQTSTTYTANIQLQAPVAYRVVLWVYHNGALKHYSDTILAYQGTMTPVFNKFVNMSSWGGVAAGSTVKFVAKMIHNFKTYIAPDWIVIVSATRPTRVQPRSLSVRTLPADRYREEVFA
jgi:hypothetical protein